MNKTITLLLIIILISASSLTLFAVQLAYAVPSRLYLASNAVAPVSVTVTNWASTTGALSRELLQAKVASGETPRFLEE